MEEEENVEEKAGENRIVLLPRTLEFAIPDEQVVSVGS